MAACTGRNGHFATNFDELRLKHVHKVLLFLGVVNIIHCYLKCYQIILVPISVQMWHSFALRTSCFLHKFVSQSPFVILPTDQANIVDLKMQIKSENDIRE